MAATTNNSPSGGHDLLTLLRRELARRCAANAKYSLRAFARDLRIHHSTLSQLLRGRRCLTPAAVKQLGPRLRLDAFTVDRLALGACSPGGFQPAALRAARELAGDAFRALAEWPHLAILELTRLPEFVPDSRFVARVLGIPVDTVNVALQRLIRLGLLAMSATRQWTDLTAGLREPDAWAHATIRQLLARLHQLAGAEATTIPTRRRRPSARHPKNPRVPDAGAPPCRTP